MSSSSSTRQDYKSKLQPLTSIEDSRKNPLPFERISSRSGQSPGVTKASKHLTDDSDEVYVHPMEKRSSYSLSTESLEMCTEGLGNETGCVFYSSMEEFSVLVLEKQSFLENKAGKSSKKVGHSRCFPPPLSTISGKDVVQVRSHREGGRLLIKAFRSSSCSCYFHAVREQGRLRLSMFCNDESRDSSLLGEENGEDDFDANGESMLDDCGKLGCGIGGGEWCSSGCKRDETNNLPSLPFYVAIS